MENIPMLARIRQVPTYVPGTNESLLRRWEAQGKLPGVYSGKTKLVNIPMLIEMLNAESRKEAKEK